MIEIGVKFVCGIPDRVRFIEGISPGSKLRFRFRGGMAAVVFVRNHNVITAHAIVLRETGARVLGPSVGQNRSE